MLAVRALPINQLMPAVSSYKPPAAIRCLGGRPGKNERPHPSPARTPGTPSIIMSPDRRPWTQISSLVPFGDARACGKIGCGRAPRSTQLGAASPKISLIQGADGGAAHCCYEHESPTLFHPVRFLRATASL